MDQSPLALRTALSEGEQRYRILVETSHDVIWAVDGDGRITFMNAASRRVYGREPEEMIGRHFLDFMPPELHAREQAFFARSIQSGTDVVVDYENRVRHKDGSIVVLSANAYLVRDEAGRFLGSIGSSRDITALKRSEQQLRESRRQLARAQEIAGLGYWEYDSATAAVSGSRAFRRMLGIADDLPPQPLETVLEFIHAGDRERARTSAEQSIARGKAFEFEARLASLDGGERIAIVSGEAIKDAVGRMTKVIGTCLDITGQRMREEQLRAAVRDVRTLARRLVNAQESERRRMAENLHDEVGQNLTALSINCDILIGRMSAFDADTRRRLQDSRNLLDAVSNGIDAALHELRPPMLDDLGLGPTMASVADEFRRRTGLAVRVRATGRPRRIARRAEIALIRVLQEALNNVAKHANARQVDVALNWRDDGVQLDVSDDGAGFRHRRRGDREGLGLALMRERILAVNGTFDLHSAPGRGTRLVARVPG